MVPIVEADPVVVVAGQLAREPGVLRRVIDAGELAAQRLARLLGGVVVGAVEREQVAVVAVLHVAGGAAHDVRRPGVDFARRVAGLAELRQPWLLRDKGAAVADEGQPEIGALLATLHREAASAVGERVAARLRAAAAAISQLEAPSAAEQDCMRLLGARTELSSPLIAAMASGHGVPLWLWARARPTAQAAAKARIIVVLGATVRRRCSPPAAATMRWGRAA